MRATPANLVFTKQSARDRSKSRDPSLQPIPRECPPGSRASRPQRAEGPQVFKRARRPRSRENRIAFRTSRWYRWRPAPWFDCRGDACVAREGLPGDACVAPTTVWACGPLAGETPAIPGKPRQCVKQDDRSRLRNCLSAHERSRFHDAPFSSSSAGSSSSGLVDSWRICSGASMSSSSSGRRAALSRLPARCGAMPRRACTPNGSRRNGFPGRRRPARACRAEVGHARPPHRRRSVRLTRLHGSSSASIASWGRIYTYLFFERASAPRLVPGRRRCALGAGPSGGSGKAVGLRRVTRMDRLQTNFEESLSEARTVRCAAGRTGEPAPLTKQIESREPRAESREPRAESREPRAESREPRAESREPRAESREPRAESREPRAESREPRAESREPRAESREPRAESREPRAESREPAFYTGAAPCPG